MIKSPASKSVDPLPAQITSIHKAFHVLEFLASRPEPSTLGEVADACSLPKPSAVRLLKTLQLLGYADRPRSSRNYCIGPKVAELAKADPHAILKRQTRTLMEKIYEEINETVNLGVLSGQRVKYLDYIETTRPLRMIVAPGSDDPWYRTALGRAIAAHLPLDEQTLLLANSEFSLAGNGPRSNFTSRSMGAKLSAFRAQGYAEELEEAVEGAGCLAVSLEPLGFSFAAISVAVPLQRLAVTRKKLILKSLFNGVRNAKSRA